MSEKKYRAYKSEYKGNPVLSIHELTDEGVSDYAIIKFGAAKAQAIVECMEQVEKFAEQNKPKSKQKSKFKLEEIV